MPVVSPPWEQAVAPPRPPVRVASRQLPRTARTRACPLIPAVAVTMYVSDSFNRADSATTMGNTDSAYGGTTQTWTPNGGQAWGITGNKAYNIGASQNTTVVDSSHADCTVTVTLVAVGDNGPCWRSTDDSNYWLGAPGTVYKRVAGSFTAVASFTAYVANDVVDVVLSGSAGTLKKNGTTAVTWSDAHNSTATKHGLRSNASGTDRFDDFKVSP